jgi:hypothetical protein
VGSRTITVTVNDDSESSAGQTFTFGDGPLSVFTEFTATGTQWAVASGNPAFQNLDGTNPDNFPAAKFCGGSVENNVSATNGVLATADNAGFTPNDDDGGWAALDAPPYPDSTTRAGKYATTSGMATGEQLLAVAVYSAANNNSGKAAGRKGAAKAADWSISYAWTGEAAFGGGYFVAAVVNFANGYAGWDDVPGSHPVVCVGRGNL